MQDEQKPVMEGEALKACPMGCIGDVIGGKHEADPVYCKKCGLRGLDPKAWNTRSDGWQPISEQQRDGEPFVAWGHVYGGIAFPCAWRPNEYSPPDQPWMNLLTGARLYEHVPLYWRPRIEPPEASPHLRQGDQG